MELPRADLEEFLRLVRQGPGGCSVFCRDWSEPEIRDCWMQEWRSDRRISALDILERKDLGTEAKLYAAGLLLPVGLLGATSARQIVEGDDKFMENVIIAEMLRRIRVALEEHVDA